MRAVILLTLLLDLSMAMCWVKGVTFHMRRNTSVYCSGVERAMMITEATEDMLFLADACIEFLSETQEHYMEAFLVYDRMICDMNETIWSLYGVDMESFLVTLKCGYPEILQLYNKLNSYFYKQQELRYGKSHMYLHKVFAPHIVCYLELEEETLKEDLDEALERETWLHCSEVRHIPLSQQLERHHAPVTSVQQVVASVKNIQKLVAELRWPDRTFAEHLSCRTQNTTAETFAYFVSQVYGILQCYSRTQRSVVTPMTVLPDEVCVMLNSCVTIQQHAGELCGNNTTTTSDGYSYRTDINDLLTDKINAMFEFSCGQLCQCLVNLLGKLARYDKHSIFSPLLMLVQPKLSIVEPLFSHIRQNNVQIKQEIHPNATQRFFLFWYSCLLSRIEGWLDDRENIDLHPFQLAAVSIIFKTLFNEFSSQGLSEDVLRNDMYRKVHNRIEYEETMNTLNIDQTYTYGYEEGSTLRMDDQRDHDGEEF